MRRYLWLLGLCLSSFTFAGNDSTRADKKDLYAREALFYASQDNYIDAIARLDIALGRIDGLDKATSDTLRFQIGDSLFAVGDLELSYRIPNRVLRGFEATATRNLNGPVRNEASYRIARIFMQKGEPENALKSIERVASDIPEDIRDDALFLRARIYMANGQFERAVGLLQELQGAKSYAGFADYNLGVALVQTGQEKPGLDQLDRVGRMSGDDEIALSLKDKANLALGFRMLDTQQPVLAMGYFDRVRLTGPYSNKALLGSGWVEVAMGRFDKALVPWSVLSKRNVTDPHVQKSLLGVPYAYAQLKLPGKASMLYGKAVEEFDKELSRLDASIKSVREGGFLSALFQIEMTRDESWIAKFRDLEKTPETRYLLELMTSHDFSESLKNYRDLEDLLKKLEKLDGHMVSSLGEARQSSIQDRKGYEDQMAQLKGRVSQSREAVYALISEQGHMLEMIAINELEQRREHILVYLAQASLGMVKNLESVGNPQAPSRGNE